MRSAFQNEFEPNTLFLVRDAEAAAALAAVRSILGDACPYSRIRESAALIATLKARNDAVIADRRAEALAKVDPQIEAVGRDLSDIGVDSEFSNQCLKPLQDIRKRIEHETRTGQITNLIEEAADAAKEAHQRIEQAVQLAKPLVAPPVDPDVSPKTKFPLPMQTPTTRVTAPENFRPRRQISAKQISKKTYLETKADVDDYLSDLRQQLEDAIAANARIEII